MHACSIKLRSDSHRFRKSRWIFYADASANNERALEIFALSFVFFFFASLFSFRFFLRASRLEYPSQRELEVCRVALSRPSSRFIVREIARCVGLYQVCYLSYANCEKHRACMSLRRYKAFKLKFFESVASNFRNHLRASECLDFCQNEVAESLPAKRREW